MKQPAIFLDYQSTTPMDPGVAVAMQPWLGERFGNPHSEHLFGWEASGAVEAAREQVARVIVADPQSIIFTSGATEASNLALKGTLTAPGQQRTRIVTVATEHSCVLDTAHYLAELGAGLTVLGVDRDGLVDLDEVRAAVDDEVALVSVMSVNNEIGTIQPIAEIADIAHAAGAVMHCDAAQAYGKIPLDIDLLGADLVSMSAHKIYGPIGIGALFVRPGLRLAPLLHGGGQEGAGLRSGTLSPALCIGFGAAAGIALDRLDADAAAVRALWDQVTDRLEMPHCINGSIRVRWHGNLNLSFPEVDGSRLMSGLRGVAVSAGAACASAAGKDSHVLAALGLPAPLVKASLRIGWGRFTTKEEIDRAMDLIEAAVAAARLNC